MTTHPKDALVRSVRTSDVHQLAPRLRMIDREEASAATGKSPLEALLIGVARSPASYSVLLNGKVICIFGASMSHIPGLGIPWLLASDDFYELPLRLMKETPLWLSRISQPYSKLQNYVSAENHKAIRWLQWLGFEFQRKVENFGGGPTTYWEFCMEVRQPSAKTLIRSI